MTHLTDPLKGLFLIGTGTAGGLIAIIKPWQEQIEWTARMALLTLSIASVLLGIWAATRKKK